MTSMTRSPSGFSAWRMIAEELRREIVEGQLAVGAKLPSESELAERFGVHRNTVRQAVAALAAEHLVVARRGSGTFVAEHALVVHRIGVRTRLSNSVGARGTSGRLLEWALEAQPPLTVSQTLRLDGRPALRMESVRAVDGLPISRATHWFDPQLVPDLHAHYAALGSITLALREVGVADYVRTSTSIGARVATVAETADLDLPAGTVVLVARAVDALTDGTPLQVGMTRVRADRVELDIEHPPISAEDLP